MCHKTNHWGRRLAWLNRELLLGLRKKRSIYQLWKKGQMIQEEYRGLIRSCREEIGKAKAQLELRLATAARDNKKCFYKYINHKKRAKQILHPLLDARGTIVKKNEEKAEVLNTFFASMFNSRTGYSQGSQPPVLEVGKESRINLLQSRRKELTTSYATWTLTSLWGLMGSTREC